MVLVSYTYEEVSGISIQAPVRFNYVKVGYYKKVEINPIDPQQIILILKIKNETPITTSTIAPLRSEGIIGSSYAALKALTTKSPPLIVKPGEKYSVISSKPSLFIKVSTALQEVTGTIEKLGNGVHKVFNKKDRQTIDANLFNIQKITKTLTDNSKNIDEMLNLMKELMRKAPKKLPVSVYVLRDTLLDIKTTMRKFDYIEQK